MKKVVVGIAALSLVLLFESCGTGKAVSQKKNNSHPEKSKVQQIYEERNIIEAAQFKMMGNYQEAEKSYQKILASNPDNDVALFELARVKDAFQQPYEAILLIEKAVEINQQNKWYYMLQADLYQKSSKFERMPEVYQNLVRLEPNNIEFLQLYASSYLVNEDYKNALKVLDQLEQISGINEQIALSRKDIYLKTNAPKKAIKELKSLCEKYPENERYFSILAELYLQQDMKKEALKTYNKVVELVPNDPYIHFTLADFYKKENDIRSSLEQLKLGFANEDMSADSKIQLLLKFYELEEILTKDRTTTLELVGILVDKHPESTKANSLLADLLIREGQFEQAYESLKAVLKEDKSQYVIWESTLGMQLELKKYQELTETAEEAVALFPYQPLPFLYHGIALIQLKNYEEAISVMKKGQNYVFDQPALKGQFYSQIGDCYNELKDYEKSDEYYDKALKENPLDKYVLNNYSYYLSLRKVKLDKAKEMAEKAVALDPENANFTDTYGWVLYQLGDYAEAEKWIKKSMDASTAPGGVVLEHYGDVKLKLGDEKEALKYWKKALEKKDHSEELEQKIEELLK